MVGLCKDFTDTLSNYFHRFNETCFSLADFCIDLKKKIISIYLDLEELDSFLNFELLVDVSTLCKPLKRNCIISPNSFLNNHTESVIL